MQTKPVSFEDAPADMIGNIIDPPAIAPAGAAPLPVSQTADTTIVRSLAGTGIRQKSAPADELSIEKADQLRRAPPLYTTLPEIAIVLQVSQRTVMRYVEDRRIPVMNRGKHALLFNTSKVLEALERCS